MAAAKNAGILIVTAALLAGCDGGGGDPGRPRVRIGNATWNVELATDEETRHRGLSGRKELPPRTGMLFAFPREQKLYFHMRGCHVPLDVAFISSRLTVVAIETMPVEADPSNPTATYRSKWPAQYALEVPAGELTAAGVAVGDAVELRGGARNAAKDAR